MGETGYEPLLSSHCDIHIVRGLSNGFYGNGTGVWDNREDRRVKILFRPIMAMVNLRRGGLLLGCRIDCGAVSPMDEKCLKLHLACESSIYFSSPSNA